LDTAQSGDTKKELKAAAPRKSRNDKRTTYRSMEIDSHNNLAVMYISSFDDGSRLKSFYRKSFRKIKKEKIPNLVIDIRNNGGGKVNHYTQLARYIRHTPFKVADTAYAIRRHFGTYGKYFQQRSINSLGLKVFTSPDTLNRYHFRYWENHAFKPKRQNHFTGQVYVLISGPTFSASTLFCNTVAGQKNVILVGEETGGGHYGNNGLMIPYITLPNTRMRVSVPLFRIVQYNHSEKNGRGVQPDIVVPPAAEAVRNGIDLKMEKVRELIREPQSLTRQF
jgi:C-terminal processing protease CtpA/Prc